ncbi:MAG: hypothetical protein Q8R28_13910 [Dehalococcoidia bacterium]|nr:hypothetical protein [Dehalococcoidia bacterium]
MPLSKKRDAARKRAEYAARKKGGTALVSKALVRKLARLGIKPERYLGAVPVSLDDYRDLERRLQAKMERVEWQSGGIRMLREENARLQALLATQPAMQDPWREHSTRIAQMEFDLARLEAVFGEDVRSVLETEDLDSEEAAVARHKQHQRGVSIETA